MANLFPDVKEARELLRKKELELPDRIKNELLEKLPGRISRHIDEGDYYIYHNVGCFATFHTKYYVEAVKKVQDLLKAEGYHVESYVEEYNYYYNKIKMLISWDIDHVSNDEYLLSRYNSEKIPPSTRKTIKEIK